MSSDIPQFRFDVFIHYLQRDKEFARMLATRLSKDGLKVWFDEDQRVKDLEPEDQANAIDSGLEASAVLAVCLSGPLEMADAALVEQYTIRFRDPLIKNRRLIPIQIRESFPEKFLPHFSHLVWFDNPEDSYQKLRDTCLAQTGRIELQESKIYAEKSRYFPMASSRSMPCVAFSASASKAAVYRGLGSHQLWDIDKARLIREWNGGIACTMVANASFTRLLTGGGDTTVRLLNAKDGSLLRVFRGHLNPVTSVFLHKNEEFAASASSDMTARIWDTKNGNCKGVFEGHYEALTCVFLSKELQLLATGSLDSTIRLWDVSEVRCKMVLEGHDAPVHAVAINHDESRIYSASADQTVRIWDSQSGRCLRVLEGHTGGITALSLSPNGKLLASGAEDGDIRLWDVEVGSCIVVMSGHTSPVCAVIYAESGEKIFSGATDGGMCIWDVGNLRNVPVAQSSTLDYTNAKVLLVGESGVGKTGLSNRLAHKKYEKTDSTVGAWSSQWRLPVQVRDGAIEREIWLWDFGGQADQRLIQQLFMDGTSLAVLVCNPCKEDLLLSLSEWDRDLTRAAASSFSRVLVAGRIDAGGLRISRGSVEEWVSQKGYKGYLETSAKEDIGCDELRDLIVANIDWSKLPLLSNVHFKRIKDGIIAIKDGGTALMQMPELREQLSVRLAGWHFTDKELATVISRLAAPGVVWDVGFGGYILLKPECISIAGQAVVRTLRADERELGCISESRILSGDIIWPADSQDNVVRISEADEPVILRAMHKSLIERGLCLREGSPHGGLLVFPSYARRERPAITDHPAVFVSYRFSGFLDEIYATLVVRLHHTDAFDRAELWRYAADFKTQRGKRLGLKMMILADGAGELQVYSEVSVSIDERILFAKFVQEHLEKCAQNVKRLRHYYCAECSTPVGNLDVAMRRLAEKGRNASLPCVNCDDISKRVQLWDDIEEKFADPQLRHLVYEMDQKVQIVLDNESRELALVGDVITTVALANQIPRQYANSDHGIDMEIEFKNARGEASGRRIYLQLKSGDSHLRRRKGDNKEMFAVSERHARYWQNQGYPVWLIVRASDGQIRWMNVTECLERATNQGAKEISSIEFKGAKFDAMAVWRLRDQTLANLKEQGG